LHTAKAKAVDARFRGHDGIMNGSSRAAFFQKMEKLHALAQPALHHLRAADHFVQDRRDFR
jgi:hypothetical protein